MACIDEKWKSSQMGIECDNSNTSKSNAQFDNNNVLTAKLSNQLIWSRALTFILIVSRLVSRWYTM